MFDARRPILSTMMLAKSGFEIKRSSKEHCIMARGKVIAMAQHNGLPFLESYPEEADVQPVKNYGGHGVEPSQEAELFDGACDAMIAQGDARRARGNLIPPGPSHPERRQHELTRSPFRAWCHCCVSGRGTENPHAQGKKGPDRSSPWSRPTMRSCTQLVVRTTMCRSWS